MNPLRLVTAPRLDGELRISSELRARLEALFEAVTILSPTSFRFANGAPVELAPAASSSLLALLGVPYAGWPQLASRGGTMPSSGTGVSPGDAEALMVEALWPVLYQHTYTVRFEGGPLPMNVPTALPQPDPALITRLSAANRGHAAWDPLWKVYQLGANGQVHVQKGDTYRLALPGEYAFSGGPGRPPALGDTVSLMVHRDSQVLQPGFYFFFGETLSSEFDDAQLARLYFNATIEGMPWIVELVSGVLNKYRVPFRMKCLTTPEHYGRTDSAVLYLSRRFLPVALRLLAPHRGELGARLKPDVPLFTRQLCPGVGGADDPGSAESFGQARCRLLAHAIVDAWQRGQHSPEDRLAALAARFSQLGLDLERPHLNEGLEDLYQWPITLEAAA